MTNIDKALERLESLIPNLSEEDVEAVEAGCDALAFLQAIHRAFVSIGRIDEKTSIEELATAVDNVQNELSASVLFLAGLPNVPAVLEKMASAYEKNDMDKDVAGAIAKSYRDLAKTVNDVQIAVKAQKNNTVEKTA